MDYEGVSLSHFLQVRFEEGARVTPSGRWSSES